MNDSIILKDSEIAFAINVLGSIVRRFSRRYSPETAAGYMELIQKFSVYADTGRITLPTGDKACYRLAFAILNADSSDPGRQSIMDQLHTYGVIPHRALTADQLMGMHGKPVFVSNLNEWGLIDIVSDSRDYGPLPWARGLTWHYDVVRHGLICTTKEA